MDKRGVFEERDYGGHESGGLYLSSPSSVASSVFHHLVKQVSQWIVLHF